MALQSKYFKSGWTPERRERQRAAIRRWKPWEKSTGPKTERGKFVAALNAYAGSLSRMSTDKLLAEISRDLGR